LGFIFVLIVGLLAGTISGIVGTGSSIMLMPVLIYQYGPKEAVPIMAVAAVMANFSRILAWWREVDWRACLAYSVTGIPAAALGARTLLVKGDFDACLSLVQQASERLGIYLLNSINPFRIEGQKTIAIEALEQLGWDPPDWLVLPAGNLGNTAAFGKALREVHALGLIERIPRIAAIQAEGAAPFASSFRDDFTTRPKVKAETVATAIRIGDPASFERAVQAIRFTNGVVTTVSDTEILDAKAVVDASGVGCEPASAASVAGVRRLVQEGIIRPSDRVVAVLTGHVLKDPGALLRYHQELAPPPRFANSPVEIEPTVEAVERIIGNLEYGIGGALRA